MIPKILHYCWFGPEPMPESHRSFIAGWRNLHPGWEIRRWDETNAPLHLPYLRNARDAGKWANLSNYVRLHALYREGGVYLDTDVELLRPLDSLLRHLAFLGFESRAGALPLVVNNAVMGAIPRHPFVAACKERLLLEFDGTEAANASSPLLCTRILREHGLQHDGPQQVMGVSLLPSTAFYPVSWEEEHAVHAFSDETIAIHHWSKSWVTTVPPGWFSSLKQRLFRSVPAALQHLWLYGPEGWKLQRERTVATGPFQGMRYATLQSGGSSLMPKLAGTYECCLHRLWYRLLEEDYRNILVLGCDEGYYAVGLARLFPGTPVLAADIRPEALALTRSNAMKNGVGDQVETCLGFTDAQSFAAHLDRNRRMLVLCDVEGDENLLFDETTIPRLAQSDVVIELHEFLLPDIREQLVSRFQATHRCEIIAEETLPAAFSQFLQRNRGVRRLYRILDENRPEPMVWAYFRPHGS